MFRPSTERGIPAFGWAAKGREVAARTRSIGVQHCHRAHAAVHSRSRPRPTLSSRGANVSGVDPSRQFAILIDGDLCHDRETRIYFSCGQHRLVQFFK